MTARRILIETLPGDRTEVVLTGTTAHYVARVLRLEPGDVVRLVDGHGRGREATIIQVGPGGREVRLDPGHEILGLERPTIDCTVLLAVLKGPRMDQAVRQLTEIGVSRIAPMLTERTVPRLSSADREGRPSRWRKIAEAALRQSGRSALPQIEAPLPIADAIIRWRTPGPNLAAWEGEKARSAFQAVRDALPFGQAAILIGPEGGLSQKEAVIVRDAGFEHVSLGRAILRSETAAVALASLVMLAGVG